LLAGALLVGGGSSVLAAKGKATTPHAFAYGKVSNLSAGGFTLTRIPKKAASTTAAKVVQVTLSGTTKEKARKGTTGALSNGEWAFVVGAKATTGISANRVVYSVKAFNAHRMSLRIRAQRIHRLLLRHAAVGKVSATSSTSLSITTAKGKTLTFAITSQTKYRVNKQLATTVPSFTKGEKVRVRFVSNATTKSLTARVIIVVPVAAA